jgi:integrase
MRLTAATIHTITLPEGIDDKIFFDDDLPGFGLRLRRAGKKTWAVQYAIAGRTRRMSLGSLAVLDLAKARRTAKDILAAVRLGRDPAHEKEQSKIAAGETFAACLKLYLERRRNDPKLRRSSYGEIERHLDRNLKALHGLPIHKLDRRAIALELSRFTEIGPIQANRTRDSLRKFLNWCVGEGFIESNPAQFTNKNPEKPRERVLSDAELRKVWLALPQGDYGDIVRLLALTGQRLSEIGDLNWDEIDLDRGVITLASSRTKNRRQHTIPLSAPALAILKARPQNGRAFVFGRAQAGFGGWGHCKEQLDAAVQIPPFVIHDIRRTVSTGLGNIGIAPHVIEQILNHQSGTKAGVSGVYNKSLYEPETRAALDRWADHLMAVMEERLSNVTPLKRA